MKTISKFLLLFLVTIFFRVSYAESLGPGKYYGIVVFDRWDGCILYRGVYVVYISENVKDELRKYAGQLIEVYAADVFQPVNPGDGRIRECEYLGRPAETKENFSLDGLEVKTFGAFRDGEKPTLAVKILNSGIKDCQVLPEELAPTLLTKQPSELRPLSPSDGPSIALLTRRSIRNIAKYGGKGSGVAQGVPYSWSAGGDGAVPRQFVLRPGEEKQILMTFDLPAGEYEFFAGYGGGQYGRKCIMSNSICFDVGCDGKGKIVTDARKTEVPSQQTSEVVNGLQLALAFRPRHDGWDELAISLKNAGSETFDIGSRVLVFLEARVGPECWRSFQHSGWYLGGREQLLTLEPGQVQSRVVTLREFFVFTPGKYMVRVTLVVDHDMARKYNSNRVWTGVIRSNHVEIALLPEEAKASSRPESESPL